MYGWEHLVVSLETDLLRIKRHTLLFFFFIITQVKIISKEKERIAKEILYTIHCTLSTGMRIQEVVRRKPPSR